MSDWQVVDTSYLRSPLLDAYCRENLGNRVVFTAQGCMELYKGGGLENLRQSLAIVSRYPSQVVILKGTRELVALQDRLAYTTSRARFVHKGQTRGFRQFCDGVSYALGRREPRLLDQFLQKKRLAHDRFADGRKDAEIGIDAIQTLAAEYGPQLQRQLRTQAALSENDGQIIITKILELTAALFRDHPEVTRMPSGNELTGSVLFRYALAMSVLAMRWISDGGIDGVSPDKLANDLVDVTHIVYATYFDGLLSQDKRLNEIYVETDWLLRNVFR